MIVIVTGGRDFANTHAVTWALDQFDLEDGELWHGGARGADFLGWQYALQHDYRVREFRADWDTHGKAAGHIRNQEMITAGVAAKGFGLEVVVVAFPGGRGTADCVRRARAAGLTVMECEV